MIILYVTGALLWALVLFAVLRRLAERRQAQRRWQADRAEAERLWWQCENERYELLRAMQHVMWMKKLEAHQ